MIFIGRHRLRPAEQGLVSPRQAFDDFPPGILQAGQIFSGLIGIFHGLLEDGVDPIGIEAILLRLLGLA